MDTAEKYLVYKRLKEEHSIQLSEDQVEVIDSIYKNHVKESKVSVMLYRLVNVIISFFMFFLLMFFENYNLRWWFAGALTLCFSGINIFYLFKNAYSVFLYKQKHNIEDE